MKKTVTTLYEVYKILLEEKNLRALLEGNNMSILSLEVTREGTPSLRLVTELASQDAHTDSVSWQAGFGKTRVIVEAERKAPNATIVLAPLDRRQCPLVFVVERKSLPRKFR